MKILQVPYGFYPDPVGGTEVYVASLSRYLQALGLEIVVAAPGDSDIMYTHEDLLVHRYAVDQASSLETLYGSHDPTVALAFARVLDKHRPDIVHLHAFTRGISVSVLQEAKRRHLPTVFTYHTPTVSCQRGTLLRWGTEVCDGYVGVRRCTACALQGLGVSRKLTYALAGIPSDAGRAIGLAGLSGRMWTALRMRHLIDVRSASFRSLMAKVDHIIAVSEWVRSVLLINGVPNEKISLSRHGLDWSREGLLPRHPTVWNSRKPLRVAFLGRLDRTKGIDVVVRALLRIPEAPIEFHVYGIVQGSGGARYAKRLRELANDDPRIRFMDPVSSNESISVLREFDLLAVPSQGLETGPLVILEAFSAGIPVIGSDIGGIAELVEHNVNGLLVPPQSVDEWAAALQRLAEQPDFLNRLHSQIRPPRTMNEVAREMLAVYGSVLKPDRTALPAATFRETV